MALNWKSTGSEVQNLIEAAEDDSQEQGNLITLRDSVVWATLAVGFPGKEWSITEKNWREFFQRVYQWERLIGSYRTSPEGPIYLTPEEIHMCIGIYTNSGNKTAAQWKKDMDLRWKEHANEKLRLYDREQRESKCESEEAA